MDTKRLPEEAIPELQWVGRMVNIMDTRFRIPGTSFRFGLDPLIGLIPFAGEIVTFVISGLLILAMARHGVSGKVLILMILNIVLDFLLGYVPLAGDVADFFYKANQRNYRLLKAHYHERKYQGSGIWILVMIVVILLLILAGLIALGLWLLSLAVGAAADMLNHLG